MSKGRIALLVALLAAAALFALRGPIALRVMDRALARNMGADPIAALPDGLHVLLCGAGGVLGLFFAWAAVRALVRFGPENLPRLHEVALGAGAVGWTALLALLASLLFGAIPLLRRSDALAPTLREGGRGSTAGRARFRARNALMAAQVALALVLLVGSGLMVRSFMRLRAVDPGFDPHRVLTFNVALNATEFPGRLEAIAFHEALLERIRGLPGVESAGAVTCLPLSGSCWGDPLQVRGRPIRPGAAVRGRRAGPGIWPRGSSPRSTPCRRAIASCRARHSPAWWATRRCRSWNTART